MSHEAVSTPAEFALKDFAGTYLGITPSDESVVVFGEVEVTIDETDVIARYATGNGIEEFFTPDVQIRETDPAAKEPSIRDDSERARALRSGIDLDGTRTFKVGSLDYIFATLTSPDIKMPALIIEGTMGDETAPHYALQPRAD